MVQRFIRCCLAVFLLCGSANIAVAGRRQADGYPPTLPGGAEVVTDQLLVIEE